MAVNKDTQRALDRVSELLERAKDGEWVSMQAIAAELGLDVEEHEIEPDTFGLLGKTLYAFWERDAEHPLFLVWAHGLSLGDEVHFYVVA